MVNYLVAHRFANELGVEEEIWFLEYHQPQLAIWRKGSRASRGRSSDDADGESSGRALKRSTADTADGGRSAMTMHAMPVMLGVLAILAIAYRYYSAFLAARVAVLDDARVTPAHRFNDGQNFDPTNRWVLFGHHFAAISGAGPLIGPVLAIQFGYLPGLVWLVVGVCLAGAVQDMMVLAASTRRDGLSLAGLARAEIGRPAGLAAAIAILYIVIIALAGLGIVVVKALGGEEVRMKAGTRARISRGFRDQPDVLSRSARRSTMSPPARPIVSARVPARRMVINERFDLTVPHERTT